MGSLPATYDSQGNLEPVGQGSLIILDRNGNVVDTISDSQFLENPRDLTVNDQGVRPRCLSPMCLTAW